MNRLLATIRYRQAADGYRFCPELKVVPFLNHLESLASGRHTHLFPLDPVGYIFNFVNNLLKSMMMYCAKSDHTEARIAGLVFGTVLGFYLIMSFIGAARNELRTAVFLSVFGRMTIQRRRTFTPEFKLEAAQLVVEQNYSIREAANAMNMGKSTMD